MLFGKSFTAEQSRPNPTVCVGTSPTNKLTYILAVVWVCIVQGPIKCLNIMASAPFLWPFLYFCRKCYSSLVRGNRPGYIYACMCELGHAKNLKETWWNMKSKTTVQYIGFNLFKSQKCDFQISRYSMKFSVVPKHNFIWHVG